MNRRDFGRRALLGAGSAALLPSSFLSGEPLAASFNKSGSYRGSGNEKETISLPNSTAGNEEQPAEKEIKLKGLRVRLGQPTVVTAELGYEVAGAWAFIHLTPTIAKFPDGELIVTYTLVPDTNANPMNVSGSQISKDNGRTWGPRSTMLAEHQPMIYVPKVNNSLMAIPAYLYEARPGDEQNFRMASRTLINTPTASGPGDEKNFRAPHRLLERGGERVIVEPGGVRVVDWPWPPALFVGIVPRDHWIFWLCFDGNAIKIDGHLIATGYFHKRIKHQGSSYRPPLNDIALCKSVLLASEDEGRTWRYLSTIADGQAVLKSGRWERGEGPSETSMVQLADGDLMAVFRVSSGQPLGRVYSSDGGRSWTKPEPIPPYSVEPSLVRIANGVIALSSGRPGIRVWFSTDTRGAAWQDIDIVAYHNRWAPDPSYRIGPPTATFHDWQTSSYTEMVEVSPNRLLLVYDRGAKPKPANDKDLSRVFVLPIEVDRN